MIKKTSLLNHIKVSTPDVIRLREEFLSEKKSFVESLTAAQVTNVLPPTMNLGSTSSGKPITKDTIAAQDNLVQMATSPNGTVVYTDPKTGQITVAASDPKQVSVASTTDIDKLKQYADLIKQLQQQKDADQATDQKQVAQQVAADQKTKQSSQVQQSKPTTVSEGFSLDDLLKSLEDVFASVEPEKEKSSKEEPKSEEPNSEETANTSTTSDDGLIPVSIVSDTLIDPDDAISALGDNFWTPPGKASDYVQQVKATQLSVGANETPVEIKTTTVEPLKFKPNMAQYVKTGLNNIPSANIGNDFDDVLGLDSPISIKLAINLGK